MSDNKSVESQFRRRTCYMAAFLVVILVVAVGVSFAFFTKVLKGTKNIVVKTGDLVVTFSDSDTIDGAFVPMSDEMGLETSGYKFVVENNGSLNASYKIELYTDTSVSGTPIPHEYLMVSLNGGTPKQLSLLEKTKTGSSESDNMYLLGTQDISTGQSLNNVIRLWVKKGSPNTIIGNKVAIKIKVTSQVNNSNPSSNPSEETT